MQSGEGGGRIAAPEPADEVFLPGLGSRQRVQECAPETLTAADVLEEETGSRTAAAEWHCWVRHNWLPVLSLALGPHWQTKYDSEVAAIIALQISLQPPAAAAAQQGAGAATMGLAAPAAAAGPAPAAPLPANAHKPQQAATPATAALAAAAAERTHGAGQLPVSPTPAAVPAVQSSGLDARTGFPVRAFSLECVDVDGKRRRLRRKRAASPDLCPPPPSAAAAAAGEDGPARQAGRAAAAPDSSTAPAAGATAPQPQLGSPGGGSHAPQHGGGGSATGLAVAMQPPSPVLPALRHVIAQVSQLSLGKEGACGHGDATPGDSIGQQGDESGAGPKEGRLVGQQPAPMQHPGDFGSSPMPASPLQQEVAQRENEDKASSAGSDGGIAAALRLAAAPPQAGPEKDGAAPAPGSLPSAKAGPAAATKAAHAGGSCEREGVGAVAAAGAGQQLLQRSLLDSLCLVQDLSRRIVTDLKEVAEARGLSLPQQFSEAGPLPLSMLLGGALVDRMDLLGRAAVHVAAATGRAEVVCQLAAAGCSVNKPLPMDFRLLLERHPDLDPSSQQQQQEQTQQEQCQAPRPAHPVALPPAKRPRHATGRSVSPIGPPSLQYCTALHLAALHGHLPVVEALLEVPGCDVNARNAEGATPLHVAAHAGESQVVALLCRVRGTLLDAQDHLGRTPLHVAAAADWDDVVVELWAKGAAIDTPDVFGWTALHYAACNGHAEVAGKLIIAGSRVQAAAPEDVTPAHLAAERGHASIVEKLLLAGYMPDTALGAGRARKRATAAASLEGAHGAGASLEAPDWEGSPMPAQGCAGGGSDADGNDDDDLAGATALHLAAAWGHLEVIEKLLRTGAHPQQADGRGRNALDLAVARTQFRVCPRLLDVGCGLTGGPPAGAGSGPSSPDSTAPAGAGGGAGEAAVPAGEALSVPSVGAMLRWLGGEEPPLGVGTLAHLTGDETVGYGYSAPTFLECAAAAGRLHLVTALLAKRAEHGGRAGKDSGGGEIEATLLAAAVRGGALGVAGWLLQRTGGPEGARRLLAKQPLLLHLAAEADNRNMVQLLLTMGADPQQRDAAGRTALHAAAAAGAGEAAALILVCQRCGGEGWADLAGAADERGWTALHCAASQGLTELAAELATAPGVDRDAQTLEGHTAVHLAARAGHAATIYALLEAKCSAVVADARGWMPLHYVARRGDLAFFNLMFAMTAPHLTPAAGAALLTCALRGGSSEMVGIVLLTGVTSPAKCAAAGEAPTHVAAREGFVDALRYLRGTGFGMTGADGEGRTPLHHAPLGFAELQVPSKRGVDHTHVAAILVAAGCSVDAKDSQGRSPLHLAAGAGCGEMAARFLELSSDYDAPDGTGWTPLFWACSRGHAPAAEALLSRGATPWATDRAGRLPLHHAAEGGHLGCVRALARAMRRPLDGGEAAAASLEVQDRSGHTPVALAAEGGHPECVAVLLEQAGPPLGATPAAPTAAAGAAGEPPLAGEGEGEAVGKQRTALHLAAARGLLDIAKKMLATRRCHANAKDGDGWLPLHHAAGGGHAPLVQLLLAAHSDVDDVAHDGDTALHKAALGGHAGVVQLLVRARCQVDVRNSSGSTPLYNASSQGHVAVLQELLSAGATVDAPTTNGCTPLYIAANNGFHEAASALLEAGANPDGETHSGCSPLHAAALNGHGPVVGILLEHGCDLDLQSQNGSSALHNSASGGHLPVVGVLLAAGADCDVQNSNGNTPLHLAAAKGWAEVAEKLLAAGADVHIKNSKGWTAAQSAANSGFFDVVLRLVQYGAAWRHKGESDVVKLLCKKSSYKASYIEGRLRLAEKEHHRRRQQQQQAVGPGAPAGTAGSSEAGALAGASEDAQAAADAVMKELLQAEMEEKERTERQRAKKQAKKQQRKAAAAQQAQRAQQDAPEEELPSPSQQPEQPGKKGQQQQQPQPPQQQQPGRLDGVFDDSANEHVAGEDGKRIAAVLKPAVAATGRSKSGQPGAASAGAAAAVAGSKSAPVGVPVPRAGKAGVAAAAIVGSPLNAGTPSSRAPQRVQQQQQAALHGQQAAGTPKGASPAAGAKTAAAAAGVRKGGVPATAPAAGTKLGAPSGTGAWAMSPLPLAPGTRPSAPHGAQPAAQQAPALAMLRPAGPYAAALAGKPLPAAPPTPAPAPTAPPTRAPAVHPPATQPGQAWPTAAANVASVTGVAPVLTPFKGLAWGLPTPAQVAVAAKPAAGQGPAGAAPPTPSSCLATTAMQMCSAAGARAPSSSLGPPGGPVLASSPFKPLPSLLPIPPAPASLADVAGSPAGVSRHISLVGAAAGIGHPVAAVPLAAAISTAPRAADPFVPLFGLQLPSLPGLATSVDWSMPAAAARTAMAPFGSSPMHQPGAAVAAVLGEAAGGGGGSGTAGGGSSDSGAATAPGAVFSCSAAGSVAARPQAAAVAARGSSSTSGGSNGSGSSSIESEADELLNGIHSHVIRALGAQQVQREVPVPASKGPSSSALFGGALDQHPADGIDDVLRMQPWLHE